MSTAAKLKKRAAEFEQKRQLDRAIATYKELFELWERGGDEDGVDVTLYNRVGDMLVRDGNVAEGVALYERAVDLYAEGGFFNNAIALCNKILRTSPGRTVVYYKLGQLSARKGFKGDAKKNFLEYADRMQKAQQLDEAFRALAEFADLCPEEDDIRLMLADQLQRAGRTADALEQLQVLHERYQSIGDAAQAAATADRIRAIDPSVEVRGAPTRTSTRDAGGLVFLDLGDAPPAAAKGPAPRAPGPVAPPPSKAARATAGLPLVELDPAPSPPAVAGPVADLPLLDEPFQEAAQPPAIEPLGEVQFGAGFGTGDAPPAPPAIEGLAGLEATSLDFIQETPEIRRASQALTPIDLEVTDLGAAARSSGPAALPDDLPLIIPTPLEGSPVIGEAPAPPPIEGFDATALDDTLLPASETPIGGDLPLIEPTPVPPGAAIPGPSALEGWGDLGADADQATPAQEGPREVAAAAGPADPAGEFSSDLSDSSMTTFGGAPPTAAAAAGQELTFDDADLTFGTEPAPAPEAAPLDLPRLTSQVLAVSVDALRARVAAAPTDWALRRELAEALLDDGEREAGLEELEHAMVGFDKAGDLESASSVADEIIRLNPSSVRHHQKRVEYAFRINDRGRLIEAYIELADALFRTGTPDKAKVVYQRVLELAPDDVRAQAALSTFVDAAPPPPPPAVSAPPERPSGGKSGGRRYTGVLEAIPEAAAPPPPPTPAANDDGDFVDLGDWLREEEGPKDTRMVVAEQEPTGDEDADFNDMLRKFKQGIAENVEEEDYESHYDLGVAFKEMGLVDEAIAEFQKALRGPRNRSRTYEALGQCFIEKGQHQVAATILQRAVNEPGTSDDQLVGCLYLLGCAYETLGQVAEARTAYQRVFAVDINFRDIGARLGALDQAAR